MSIRLEVLIPKPRRITIWSFLFNLTLPAPLPCILGPGAFWSLLALFHLILNWKPNIDYSKMSICALLQS